ncbi:hypothetical protein BC941DRAFT_453298 [Chlamydoabsidia padenii]|nr:hypothetical protein BC941DRAFT_453298 [Chlamydoabsidia padenii]
MSKDADKGEVFTTPLKRLRSRACEINTRSNNGICDNDSDGDGASNYGDDDESRGSGAFDGGGTSNHGDDETDNVGILKEEEELESTQVELNGNDFDLLDQEQGDNNDDRLFFRLHP